MRSTIKQQNHPPFQILSSKRIVHAILLVNIFEKIFLWNSNNYVQLYSTPIIISKRKNNSSFVHLSLTKHYLIADAISLSCATKLTHSISRFDSMNKSNVI